MVTTLFPSFFAFDALVKREYGLHLEAWEADGRPYGMFWQPDGVEFRSRSRRGRPTQRCMSVWLIRTPHWVREDPEAARLLSRMRWFTLAWYIGVIALAGLIVLALPY